MNALRNVRGGAFLLFFPLFSILAALFISALFSFISSPAEARLLNLGGSADLSYGLIRTTQSSHVDETTYFQQRYNLNNFGDIIDPRIGTFLMSGTFLSQDSSTHGNAPDQNFKFQDYSIAVNLFPYISPLSFYAQRMTRANELDTLVKDRVTTYGANWSLSIPRLPRLSLSFNQSELRGNDQTRLPDTTSRFFNVESSGRIADTTLIGRYQFNDTDVARNTGEIDSIKGQAVNLTTESRLTSALSLGTFSRYANVGGVNAPGNSFSQERGIGASLIYTPSVFWDTHARAEYSEMPDNANFKRFMASWSGSFRPTNQLDMVLSARYFKFDVANTVTSSPFGDYNINYRPFFGLSTGFGASVGQTSTDGNGESVSSFYQRYRSYINYSRSIEILRYSASYAISYGTADTNRNRPITLVPVVTPVEVPTSDRLTDLMNTITLGVENVQIRIIHVALGYTFNAINRSSRTVQPEEDQLSHTLMLNADTSYFRAILLPDDSLLLQSSASLTRIQGFGPEGNTFVYDIRGNYFFLGGGLVGAGLTYQDYPTGFYLDSLIFYEEIQWTFFFGNTRMTLGARDGHQQNHQDDTLTRHTLEATAALGYQIGKFIFNLDQRWAADRSSGVRYISQTLFARATRLF
jgi:hypothetical protein